MEQGAHLPLHRLKQLVGAGQPVAAHLFAQLVQQVVGRFHAHIRLDEQRFEVVPCLFINFAHAQHVHNLPKDSLPCFAERFAYILEQSYLLSAEC